MSVSKHVHAPLNHYKQYWKIIHYKFKKTKTKVGVKNKIETFAVPQAKRK